MDTIFNPQNIFDFFIAVGGVAFTVAQLQIGRSAKKSGDDTEALTTIKLKDATIKELKDEVGRLTNLVAQHTSELAILRNDKSRLEAIVQNRNPELEQYMKDSMEYLKVIATGMKDILQKPTVAINNQPTT